MRRAVLAYGPNLPDSFGQFISRWSALCRALLKLKHLEGHVSRCRLSGCHTTTRRYRVQVSRKKASFYEQKMTVARLLKVRAISLHRLAEKRQANDGIYPAERTPS